jgi:hypothetical protein
MKKLIAVLLAAAAMTNVQAASFKELAAETVLTALRCELPPGKYKSVVKALKAIGAKNLSTKTVITNEYGLAAPLEVFGMPVSSIFIDNEDIEMYMAEAKGVKIAAIAAAAKATKNAAGNYQLKTKHGTLTFSENAPGEVKLACETGA